MSVSKFFVGDKVRFNTSDEGVVSLVSPHLQVDPTGTTWVSSFTYYVFKVDGSAAWFAEDDLSPIHGAVTSTELEVPSSADTCPCSGRDLFLFGHKCGRTSQVDALFKKK